MSGTASDVAGTMSATIISNTLIDSNIVIAATQYLLQYRHGYYYSYSNNNDNNNNNQVQQLKRQRRTR